MVKYQVALFIGRFQPFHKGHMYAMRKALEIADEMIIGIGSSQEQETKENPWKFEVRKRMVEAGLDEAGMRTKMRSIWSVPDFSTDEEWVKKVKLIVQNAKIDIEEVVVVSNNEWTTRALSKVGMKIYEPGFDNRDELEGKKIREIIRRGEGEWQGRVPNYVREIIDENPLV